MGLNLVYLVTFVISFVTAVSVFLYWVANRKRIAAETVGRAEEQALRIHKDAEREADTRKKGAARPSPSERRRSNASSTPPWRDNPFPCFSCP